MYLSTLERLQCPVGSCRTKLQADGILDGEEISYGQLICGEGSHAFPVLDGVAVLVPAPMAYLRRYAGAVLRHVDRSRMEAQLLATLKEAVKAEPMEGWSLESEFAVGLYAANHYLLDGREEQILESTGSTLIRRLIRDYWRDNPMTRLEEVFSRQGVKGATLLDLGCNVGGAVNRLGRLAEFSLGVDVSFSSVWRARQILRGDPIRLPIPSDRLDDVVLKEAEIRWRGPPGGRADFVVGDAMHPPVAKRQWDIVLGLGVLDIVKEPLHFLRSHAGMVAQEGYFAHSSPYLWRKEDAATIRNEIPSQIQSSSEAAEWLYEKEGLEIIARQDDIPWAFYKSDRRIEISATHLIVGKRRSKGEP